MNIINDSVILVNSSNKNRVIESLCEYNILINRKILNFNEFKRKLFFEYDEKAIYEVMKRENVSCEIANLYLKNIYNIINIESDKVNNLLRIKKYLEEERLIYTNYLFKKNIENKKIYLWNIPFLTSEEEKMLSGYDYEIILDDNKENEFKVFKAETLEDEVIFIADKIVELINSGIEVNKIKLMNLSDEYKIYIKRIFNWYKIPVNISVNNKLYSTHLARIYLEEGIERINDYVTSFNDEKLANKIIDIHNKFVWCLEEDIKRKLIINEFKNTNIPIISYVNAVEEINLEDDIKDDEYIFLLGFNQGIIPRIYKDEDYFNDIEKNELNIPTTFELNNLEKKKVIYYISKIKNLIISYKRRTLTDIFYPSSLLEELNTVNIDYENKFNSSNVFNMIMLTNKLDNYYRFGTKDKSLGILYNTYKSIPYNTYDNSYIRIDENKIKEHFSENLLLSYTSLDNYFRCNFRYYLQSVLKLNFYEETFMQQIGNLFHDILSKAFLDSFDFDSEWTKYINDNNIGVNNKEKFFLDKIKEELIFTIEVIKKQQDKSKLKEFFYEEKFYIHPTNEPNVTFMGVIDKLAYKKLNDKYIASIIDYKTGNPNLNLSYLPYGIDAQLPIYLYLAHQIDRLKPLEVIGFYLQKILHSEIIYDPKITYESQKKKNLLLQGYSTSDEILLNEFDSSYNDSEVIRSMKTSSKGFYSYSKVLSKTEMNKIVELTHNNILLGINNIKKGQFDINPKRIGFNNVGCEFCSYKDICFKKEKDIVNLKEYKDLEFLGGEENA